MVDDFIVFSDKIGAANFYWSFPSKAYSDQMTLHETKSLAVKRARETHEIIASQISMVRSARKLPNRSDLLSELASLQQEEMSLDTNIEAGKLNDPEEIERICRQNRKNQDAANRWTDNIWTIKSFLTKKRGMSGKEVSM